MSDKYPPTQEQPVVPPAEPPKKQRRWVLPTLVGVGAFILGIGAGAAGGETDPPSDAGAEPAPTVTVPGVVPQDQLDELEARAVELDAREADIAAREAALDEQDAAVEAGTVPGDGVFLVGSDIQPGEYRTSAEAGPCYWARLSGTSGDFDDIITNGTPTGPTVVTIEDSDYAFETTGCTEWTLVQ